MRKDWPVKGGGQGLSTSPPHWLTAQREPRSWVLPPSIGWRVQFPWETVDGDHAHQRAMNRRESLRTSRRCVRWRPGNAGYARLCEGIDAPLAGGDHARNSGGHILQDDACVGYGELGTASDGAGAGIAFYEHPPWRIETPRQSTTSNHCPIKGETLSKCWAVPVSSARRCAS